MEIEDDAGCWMLRFLMIKMRLMNNMGLVEIDKDLRRLMEEFG